MTKTNEATEVRRWHTELREAESNVVYGWLCAYDHTYDLGAFTEELAPGVFRKSVTEAARALPLLTLHDHESIPVGKAMEWNDSDEGLQCRWQMDTRAQAQETLRLVKEGYLDGLSVSFFPLQTHWDTDRDKPHARRVEARLLEVSLVPVPAYGDARVLATRSAGIPDLPDTRIVATPRLNEAKAWLESLRNSH